MIIFECITKIYLMRINNDTLLKIQIQNANDHSPYTRNLSHMYMSNELHDGLIYTLKLKCRMCHIEKFVKTEIPDDKLNINSAIVLATISTGFGFAQMTQFLSVMNIPQLSRRQFDEHFEKVSETILETSWETMEEAGIEEGRLACEIGDVDKNGYPLITVIADGVWSKWSYKTKYYTSSRVACIVGTKSDKLLFVSVRNKYCSMYRRAKLKIFLLLQKLVKYINSNRIRYTA
ncbi:hypothetical protein RN001_003232 [Aquatica leii]|uniref:Mutator-like transposase domain-containing protein n=1 Tax=Aquatica leii TaxID=1421715 RepID=A0AAN7PNE2_9COLE|nr:hypothetical protein RN001_003232 [Aquatica leii]